MRKVSPIILMILLCFATQALAVCPAPFEKAKQIALKTSPTASGKFVVLMRVHRDGEQTTYLIGYIPSHGIIGIGKFCGSSETVYEYNENTGLYTVWRFGVPRESIDAELCIREAFKIFREMVGESLI